MITQEMLENIRAADAAAGGDLQMAPAAWRDRRQLLEYISDMEEQARIHQQAVLELSNMLEPFSEGVTTLAELVVKMRTAAAYGVLPQQAPEPPSNSPDPLAVS